jgi:hypothetical protein
MINLESLKEGTKISMKMNDADDLICVISEFGYGLGHTRPRIFTILEVVDSTNEVEWPLKSHIIFPLEMEEKIESMSFLHQYMDNNSYNEIIKKSKINLKLS